MAAIFISVSKEETKDGFLLQHCCIFWFKSLNLTFKSNKYETKSLVRFWLHGRPNAI